VPGGAALPGTGAAPDPGRADGRLEPGELTARSEAAQQAATSAALAGIVADLPGPGQAAVAGPRCQARRLIVGFLELARWQRRCWHGRPSASWSN
jgi:Domain of unknown function (DUF1707)